MDDDGDGDGGVVEEVFDYSELQDLCDAHLQGTSCEHYHLHHAVVLDDNDGNDDDDDDADIIDEDTDNNDEQ